MKGHIFVAQRKHLKMVRHERLRGSDPAYEGHRTLRRMGLVDFHGDVGVIVRGWQASSIDKENAGVGVQITGIPDFKRCS